MATGPRLGTLSTPPFRSRTSAEFEIGGLSASQLLVSIRGDGLDQAGVLLLGRDLQGREGGPIRFREPTQVRVHAPEQIQGQRVSALGEPDRRLELGAREIAAAMSTMTNRQPLGQSRSRPQVWLRTPPTYWFLR
jgi:hypothetical protein